MRTNRFRINGPIFELWPEPALSGQNASENDGNFFYFLWSKKPQDVHTEKGRKRKFAAKKVDTWTKKEPSVVLGTFPVLQVGLARHKQSHCAHSTQMMCEISIVKLTMEIDRSVSISGYSHSGAARTVIKLEVYWFVLTHSPGKNFPNEKVREKKGDWDWEEPHRLIVCSARFHFFLLRPFLSLGVAAFLPLADLLLFYKNYMQLHT